MRGGKACLLDTNVLLRFLLGDDAAQSPRAHALLKRLETRKERAEIEDIVIAETVWVLEKGYEVPRGEIARKLTQLVQLPGLSLRGKRAVLEALTRFGDSTFDIVDCLLAARAKARGLMVRSFDRDFQRLGCSWKEP